MIYNSARRSACPTSKIDKLSIMGVRSFSNKTAEVIQFFSPLTLIVGFNGSGKTTIIECLKYATTGEMPAGAKQGGAWIHDPKLCGEKEVMAQIRLSFVSTKGDKMVLARNLQLTVGKTTRSFKALESSLSRRIQGEKVTVSSKVAEMDTLVPEFLGVSQAVLENVIFCHQDDSLWPMAVPADLKKKFDDIFEAVKYTQAVDNIKKLRKEYAENLKTLKVIESNAKDYKDKGAKLEKESHSLFEQLEELRTQSKSLGEDSDEAQQHLDECFEKISTLSTLDGDLRGKRIQLHTKRENIEKLKRNIKAMTESDAELQKMLDEYEERVDVLQSKDKEFKKQYMDIQQGMQNTRNSVSAKERELGSLEAQKENNERQILAREQLVKQIARSHAIRGFDLDITEEKIVAFKEKLTKLKREQTTALERARLQTAEALQKAQSALSSINEKKNNLQQIKDAARTIISSNDSKIAKLQSESDHIEVDEGAKATLESSIDDASSRLTNAKSQFDSAAWDRNLADVTSEINSLEATKEKLDSELVEGTKRAGDTARLDFIHKELKDRERGLQSMRTAHGDRVKTLLGPEWEIENLEAEFNRILAGKSASVTEAERQRDGLSNEVEQLNFKLRSCKTDLKAKLEEASKLESTIRDAIDDEPNQFPGRLSELEEQGDVVTNNTSASERMSQYFKDSMDTATKHSVCRLCRRAFDKESRALQKFLEQLQKDVKKLKDNASKQDADELLVELRLVRGLALAYENWKRLTDIEIPNLEAEEKQMSSRHEQLTREVELSDQTVLERQEESRDVESLSKTIQTMVKYHNEGLGFRSQIEELSTKTSSQGNLRSLEQIREDLKSITDKARAAQTKSFRISNDREHARSSINALELDLRDLKSKSESASYQLKEKLSLQRQISDLKEANTSQRERIAGSERDIQDLGPELGRAQAAYDEVSRQGTEKDNQMREGLADIESSNNRLQLAEQEINAYQDRGGEVQLHKVKHVIESMKSEIQDAEKEANGVAREVKNIENQLRNNEETKRSICDNLDYRRDMRDIENVSAEIEELEAHNVEAEKEHWERQRKHWENERLKLSAAQNKVVGQLQEKDDRLKQNLETWETDYKDAAYKYKEAHIRVSTTKAAVEDLGRYGGALDSAIMKYHSLKMEEINRIIDELWRRTYQGTDVDTILIKSENENQKGGKSYRYRVCMIKQDAEMDMRGRCSAGQKVLASIIIRLALAECFGVRCGLIALDEPTTNLDRDNIQALARALSEIIRVRRQQANFQLIVITHDEEFLRYMQCADFADDYYRVSRDANQDTQIMKQSISHAMN
ncbi:hypothetical protein ANO11243_087650 [Dothideomycetidae sp. 11243]|nr:hypothetical protein ANO11243_087650 [fungal sp. No.11243]